MKLGKFTSDTELRRVVDVLEDRTSIQRDLCMLDSWVSWNFLKSMKSKCGVLHLRYHSPIQQHRIGIDWVERSFTDKDPKIFMGIKLNVSQQCALVRNTNSMLH